MTIRSSPAEGWAAAPRGSHAAAVDIALGAAIGELKVIVGQMGPPFPETDGGKDHAEQWAQGHGGQVGGEQILEVLHQLRVLLDGRGQVL